MAIMAQKCPGHKFTLFDSNAARIAAWNSGEVPIFEPDMAPIVAEVKGKNLFFIDDSEFDAVRATQFMLMKMLLRNNNYV